MGVSDCIWTPSVLLGKISWKEVGPLFFYKVLRWNSRHTIGSRMSKSLWLHCLFAKNKHQMPQERFKLVGAEPIEVILYDCDG